MAVVNKYDGKILLSTFWDQTGVIPCGNNESISYNEYTPIDPVTGDRSYTGCANTAIGQIVYYFIENNMLDFNLTLTAKDTYVSYGHVPKRSLVISANGGAPGTVSFETINSIISKFTPVPTDPEDEDYTVNSENAAKFIAAFNFACGVVNRSDYSDLSGTAARPFLNVYERSGFQSVISTDLLGEMESKRLLQPNGNGQNIVTDEAFEVFIENLLDGRPILLAIPGHGVVLDGYDSERDMFHINYGWGPPSADGEGDGPGGTEGTSASTRWYTREEFSDPANEHFLNIQSVHFDIQGSYIDEFTVSDSRFYGTGTLLRAIEQANGMSGDNVISFTEAMAGEIIDELPYNFSMSDGILIKDFNVTIFANSTLEAPEENPQDDANAEPEQQEQEERMLMLLNGADGSRIRFENFNGNAVLHMNPNERGVIFDFSGSVRTDLFFDGAQFYSGVYDGTFSKENVGEFIQSLKGTETEKFLNNAGEFFVVAASENDDVIKFNNESFAVGNIELGSGHNKLIINNGSQIIGNISGEGKNSIFIDNTSTVTGALKNAVGMYIKLGDAINSEAVFNITGEAIESLQNILTITIDAVDAAVGEYTLFTWQSPVKGVLNNLNYKVIGNGNLEVKDNSLVLNVTAETAAFELPETWAPVIENTGNVVTINCADLENISGYSFRYAQDIEALDGSGIAAESDSANITLNNGIWYFQVRAVDANGAYSSWSAAEEVTIGNTVETVADTYLANGIISDKTFESDFKVLSGGKLVNTTVSAGTLHLENGSITTGTLNIARNAVVDVYSGAEFIFDISSYEKGNNKAVINNFSAVNGEFKYGITVAENQAHGIYILANNVEEWDPSEIVVNAGNSKLGTFNAATTEFIYEDKVYCLNFEEKKKQLQLIVDDIIDTDTEKNGSTKLTWHMKNGASGYLIELSADNFKSSLSLAVEENVINVVTPFSETLSWQFKTVGFDNEFTSGGKIKAAKKSSKAKTYAGETGVTNIFLAASSGKWGYGCFATNMTISEEIDGIENNIALKGKNRYQDIFVGQEDNRDIVYLSDDANGDTFFADDIFTASPDGQEQIRFSNISEIYAGAGDDIIDMTSARYEAANSGIIVHGGDGNDVLWANSSSFLFGDNGNDTIIGSRETDHISGGAGDDILYGGGGNDFFLYSDDPAAWGNDIIYQMAGEGNTVNIVFTWDIEEIRENISKEFDGHKTVVTDRVSGYSITVYSDQECNLYPSRYYDAAENGFAGMEDYSSENIFDKIDKGILA